MAVLIVTHEEAMPGGSLREYHFSISFDHLKAKQMFEILQELKILQEQKGLVSYDPVEQIVTVSLGLKSREMTGEILERLKAELKRAR